MSGRAGAVALCFSLLFVVGQTLPAQWSEPKRPKLEAGADTNSAQEYYQFGVQQLAGRPQTAANAFYWASRLAPPWADPYYARATALLLTDRSRLVRYLMDDESEMRSKEVLFINSLYNEAFVRNPFVLTRLDRFLYDEFVSKVTGGRETTLPRSRTGDVERDARIASLQGRYADALRYWAAASLRDSSAIGPHVERARAFVALGTYDSAVSAVKIAMEKLRARDEQTLTHAFETAAMFEHSLAYLHMQLGDDSLAREAYERALTSDLSFAHAHGGLGDLALRRGDTTLAAMEYGQAVALRPDDAGLRGAYAMVLIQANRAGEAVEELKRAIELEPWFAHPYYLLGRLFDHAGFTDEALVQYEAFVSRAPRMLAERKWALARIETLRAPTP